MTKQQCKENSDVQQQQQRYLYVKKKYFIAQKKSITQSCTHLSDEKEEK